jgi:hypothetical protein
MLSKLLDRLIPKRVIVNCEREPYLHRWFLIRLTRVGVFVHKFVRSDEDRALHDHPWSFIVIPLWGGYIEHNSAGRRRVRPLISTRYRSAEYRHRVELIDGRPSWSLFIRFTKRREWGFWEKSGFVLWNKWWEEKCE